MNYIQVEKKDKVAVVTMNYKKENRFNPEFLKEMTDTLDELEKDAGTGALVVTGAEPKFWSNGLDLEYMMGLASQPDKIIEYLTLVNGIFKRWCLYPKPTVAALNGHTFAAGLFMAAYCDFRVMREDRGWICMPEVDINIPLLPGMIAICRATMTQDGFRKLYYTGERLTGPQAKEIGFVERVCAEDQLLPTCVELAAGLAKKKTSTYAEMKRRLRQEIVDVLDKEDPELLLPTIMFSMKG